MAKKLIAVILVTVFFLSSCAPAPTPTQISTSSSIPPTPTTPRPTVTVKQEASLFAGPGNAGFPILADLPTGMQAISLGTFGDFVEVSAELSGTAVTGYVWKEALESVPSGLAAIPADQVPWMPLYLADCSPGTYDTKTGTVTFTNATDGYHDTESRAIPLTEPLRISVGGMTASPGTSAPDIKFLGIPEPYPGDWWKGITRLELGDSNGSYYLAIRDGSQANAGVYQVLPLKTSQSIQLQFDQPEGKSLRVLDGYGKTVQTLDLTATPGLSLPNGLFPNGVVYIGVTLPPQTTFTVTHLQIGVDATGKWDESNGGYYSQPGLATLAAAHKLTIGTEFRSYLTSDPRDCQIMKRDYNLAALSEFSSPDFWLGPGQYDWSILDAAVDYATRQGWRIRASHLIWGVPESLPAWLKNSNNSRDEYIQIMEQYIRDIVGRYKSRVQEWSIANEATIRSFSPPGADFWNDKIGPEYIAIAFQTAREADPNGVLIFNDVNNQAPQDSFSTSVVTKMYSTVKQLKAEGVPIDAVGMQMHLFAPWFTQLRPNKADVIATMQKFASLGVRIYITEMDVDLTRQAGTQTEKWSLETDIYKDMMEACIESGVCDSFTTWGISDADSSMVCDYPGCLNEKNADPLLFDANYAPKPAYFAVRDALLTDVTVVPSPTP